MTYLMKPGETLSGKLIVVGDDVMAPGEGKSFVYCRGKNGRVADSTFVGAGSFSAAVSPDAPDGAIDMADGCTITDCVMADSSYVRMAISSEMRREERERRIRHTELRRGVLRGIAIGCGAGIIAILLAWAVS